MGRKGRVPTMRTITQVAIVAVIAAVAAAGWHYQDRLPWVGGDNQAQANRGDGGRRAVVVEVAKVRVGRVVRTLDAVGTTRADEAVVLTAKVTGLIQRIAFIEGQWVERGTTLVNLDATALEAELQVARAERENARNLYQRAQKLLRTRNVAQARVDELAMLLAAGDASVQAKQAELADYDIRAPFSGRLGMRDVSVGALIRPGDPITTLDDTRVVKLDFPVPETELASIEPGLAVVAESIAYPDRRFDGIVQTVDSRIDPVTRSIAVRARLPNPEGLLKPGMFLTVHLVVGVKENAVLVPEEAVLASAGGQYVFAVDHDKAVRLPVVTGRRLPGEVEVLSGITPGTEVITGGIQKVRDGVPVTRRNAGAAPAGG